MGKVAANPPEVSTNSLTCTNTGTTTERHDAS